MRRVLLLPLLFVLLAATAPAQTTTSAPPVAPRQPHTVVTHGDTLHDDYFWLREKGSPGVEAYLQAENAYTDAVMAPTKDLQERLYAEMLGRIQETDMNVPYREGAYFYYSRTEQGKQYAIHCRRMGNMDAAEEVILDVNQLAEGREFMSVGDRAVSDDGNLLAYTTDETGFRQYSLHVKDLRHGDTLIDTAERVTALEWCSDNQTIYYVQEDPVTKRSHRLFRHVLGTDVHELVYEEKDELYDIWLWRTRSREFLMLTAGSSTTSEVWFLRADRPEDAFTSIAGRRDGHEYYADHWRDRFFIRTNDRGRNFRLVTAAVSAPGADWKEVIAHSEKVMIEDVDCFAAFYVVHERENGVPQFAVVDAESGKSHRIAFPEPVYSTYAAENREFHTPMFRLSYTSFVTPPTVYDYDTKTRALALLKQQPVLGGYDPKLYRSERLYAKAPDGTKVPVSIVYRVDAGEKKHPRHRPMLLMGYGSYGYAMEVGFASGRLSLLDRGVIYGIAHVRGGGELGKRWHEEGRLMEKRNTFTDFIAVADHLVKEGYTTREKLAITGGSAGGLLMGAVVNMRPDLCHTVYAAVPFVDVMNTMLDASLPLTVGEYLEWGNPNEKPAYDYMKSYSPYDNVERKPYPVMLVKTSYNDSQVMYWEPAKWVAKLRAMKTDDNLLLFRIKMDPAGHGGASGRYDRLRDTAFEYAFILTQLGVEKVVQ